MNRPNIEELINTIRACDEMAKRVGLSFVPEERKLESLGLSSDEIDFIFAKIGIPMNEGMQLHDATWCSLWPAKAAAEIKRLQAELKETQEYISDLERLATDYG